jgi:hypothetical protein
VVRRLVFGLVASVAAVAMCLSGAVDGAFGAGCRSVAGPAACLGTARPPFVTSEQAERAIAALWNTRERARVLKNTSLLSRVDTGSAARTDIAVITSVGCGCGSFYWTPVARRFRDAVIYLPQQHRYPLFFAADVSEEVPGNPSPASDAHAMLVATRVSPSEPWRIAFELYDTGDTPTSPYPAPIANTNGYDTPATVSSNTAYQWFSAYATYLNQIKKTGRQPSSTPYAPGPLTSGNGLQAHPNGYTTNGVTYTHEFMPGEFGGPWIFSVQGSTDVCGDISEYSLATPASTQDLLQQAQDRKTWGWELPPGYYRSITTLYEWPVCIFNDRTGKLGVNGPSTGGYIISATGKKTTPTSTLNS